MWKRELNTTVAPRYITFGLRPHKLTIFSDIIDVKSIDTNHIRANSGFRVWAYSQAYAHNQSVKMALEKIILTKKRGAERIKVNNKLIEPLPQNILFAGEDNATWQTVGVAGGNFDKFGDFKDNQMIVDVPPKNSWGKTGLLSRQKFITFNQRIKEMPYKVTLKVDPIQTTGFMFALSGGRYADMWQNHVIWISLIQSVGQYHLHLRRGYYSYWGRNIDNAVAKDWDGTLEIFFEEKWTKVCMMNYCVAGPVGFGAFGSAYATILSHPAKHYGASSLTLEKVTGQWLLPDDVTPMDRSQPKR